jgi:hypothetical protein
LLATSTLHCLLRVLCGACWETPPDKSPQHLSNTIPPYRKPTALSDTLPFMFLQAHSEDEPTAKSPPPVFDPSGAPQIPPPPTNPTPESAGYARIYYTREGQHASQVLHAPSTPSDKPAQHSTRKLASTPPVTHGQPVSGLHVDDGQPATVYAVLTAYPAPGAEGQECDTSGFCVIRLGGCTPAEVGNQRTPRRASLASWIGLGNREDANATVVTLLGFEPTGGETVALQWTYARGQGLRVWVPPLGAAGMSDVRPWAYVLQLTNVV